MTALALLPLSFAPSAATDSVGSLSFGPPRMSACIGACRIDGFNPHIIHVAPPESAEARARIEARDKRWVERCQPVIRQDRYGVPRYVYAAAGCEFGRLD